MNELLIYILNNKIKELNTIYSYLEKNRLLDSQEVIQWLDDLNEISVRH